MKWTRPPAPERYSSAAASSSTHGKKKAPVKALVVDTKKKGLFAKVAGKKMKLATLAGWSYTRAGFGVALTVKKLKLTKTAAKKLNKKLGFKKGKKPFVGNKLMGSAVAEEQPATVTVLPGGNVSFKADQELLLKLKDVETEAKTIAPTTEKGLGNYELPITGGRSLRADWPVSSRPPAACCCRRNWTKATVPSWKRKSRWATCGSTSRPRP